MTDSEMWRERLKDGPGVNGWSGLDWALLEALLRRPGIALPMDALVDAMWTERGKVAPEAVEVSIKAYVHRVRRGLAAMGYNPDALVNDPPYAYGLNLDALATKRVARPQYILNFGHERC